VIVFLHAGDSYLCHRMVALCLSFKLLHVPTDVIRITWTVRKDHCGRDISVHTASTLKLSCPAKDCPGNIVSY
jgi:hypothetical protein